MQILISAGEASGEMYGAQLIESLRACEPSRTDVGIEAHVGTGLRPVQAGQSSAVPFSPQFFGVGGTKMRAAGCDTIVDAKDLAVVGITEILAHLPKIWRLFRRLISEADKRKPDLAVVIDAPAFNWRVARQMKKRGIPVAYYVAPQFWAWRQGRVRLLRKYVTKALVIFPFEEQFYRDRGVDATFVGHPLANLPDPAMTRADYAALHQLDPAKQWITLMPGSRRKEIRMNLPAILKSAHQLGTAYEFLIPIAATIDADWLRKLIPSSLPIHLVPESLPALFHSRAGIIASGTATVEAAMMKLPFVMVYRVSPLTYWLGKSRVKVPFFAMVNLIAGHEVVPELVQYDFTAHKVLAKLQEILPDGAARTKMLEGLASVKTHLHGRDAGQPCPSDRAAKAIMSLLPQG